MGSKPVEPRRGSQRLLQQAVQSAPQVLLSALRESGCVGNSETVSWASPLARDEYREYFDGAALDKLGLREKVSIPLAEFWPARGPVWDALGTINSGDPLLVEAKAHIPEAVSPGSKAKAQRSVDLIRESLGRTRKFIAPRSNAVWTDTFYQYANRLAYQYYLRELNGVESRLVFLYFVNAVEMDGPTSADEWRGATRLIHSLLGLPASLRDFGVFHAYVDATNVPDAT